MSFKKLIFLFVLAFTGVAQATPADGILESLAQNHMRNLPTVRWTTSSPRILPNVKYDASAANMSEKGGYTTFFVGSRVKDYPASDFLPHLSKHVALVKRALEPCGLKGYIVLATEDYEIAYLVWDNKEAADLGFASEEGKKVGEDAQSFMELVIFKPASN